MEFLEFIRDAFHSYVSGEMGQEFLHEWIVFQVAFVVVPLGFVAVAVYWVWRQRKIRRRMRTWIETTATVTDYSERREESSSNSMSVSYTYPTTYEYVDSQGDKHTEHFVGSEEPDLGQDLTVYVNPLDRATSMRVSEDDRTASGIAFQIGVWIVALVGALLAFYWLFAGGK